MRAKAGLVVATGAGSSASLDAGRTLICRVLRKGALALALATAVTAAQPASPPVPEDKLQLHFEAGLLTLQAHDVPLTDLLHAIGEAAGFAVTIDRDLGAPAAVSFTRQPLPQVFRRLLQENSYLVFYDAAHRVSALRVIAGFSGDDPSAAQPAVTRIDDPTAADIEIWILERLASPEQNERIVAVRRLAELEADTAVNLASSVIQSDPSPVVRGEAITVLGRIGGERISDLLEMATADSEVAVRKRAIGVWKTLGGARAIEALGTISSRDPDSEARLLALHALQAIGGDAARYYLEMARADGDEEIRRLAEQALAAGENPAAGQPGSSAGDGGSAVTQ